MRNARQRSLVLNIVNNNCSHPTAYMVYQECIKEIPNISLGTVYRNLNTLVEIGLIQKLDIPNQMTRYDKVLNHDHFVCLKCGQVYDLEKSNITYDEFINGNKVYTCKIRYEGICHDCLRNDRKGDVIYGIKGK